MEAKAVELMDMVQKSLARIAPQAFNLAVQNEKWCGLGAVGMGLGFLLIALLLFLIAYIINKKWHANWKEDEFPATCIPLGVGLALFVVSMVQLLNPWNWIAIVNPKIALFHDLLDHFINR